MTHNSAGTGVMDPLSISTASSQKHHEPCGSGSSSEEENDLSRQEVGPPSNPRESNHEKEMR